MHGIEWSFGRTPPKNAFIAMADNTEEAEAMHAVAETLAKMTESEPRPHV